MRLKCKWLLSVILAIVLVFSVSMPALAAEKAYPAIFETSEGLIDYMLGQLREKKPVITVTMLNTIPEADIGSADLFKEALRNDNGFIRWGYKSGSVRITKRSETTTYEYRINYHSTKAQDNAARKLANAVVDKWEVEKLTDFEKMDKIKSYISDNWRYDDTLESMTAHSTLTSGTATCLGFTMAGQLLLDSMGIPSQTVHGRVSGVDAHHIILLVKLGDWWYTFDPSELAREKPVNTSYLQQSYRSIFTPEAEYLTDAFRNAYPMNQNDLIAGIAA